MQIEVRIAGGHGSAEVFLRRGHEVGQDVYVIDCLIA